jgi:hypothetical protein
MSSISNGHQGSRQQRLKEETGHAFNSPSHDVWKKALDFSTTQMIHHRMAPLGFKYHGDIYSHTKMLKKIKPIQTQGPKAGSDWMINCHNKPTGIYNAVGQKYKHQGLTRPAGCWLLAT